MGAFAAREHGAGEHERRLAEGDEPLGDCSLERIDDGDAAD